MNTHLHNSKKSIDSVENEAQRLIAGNTRLQNFNGTDRKVGQAVRREVRAILYEHTEQFHNRLASLNECFKNKPKYCPKWLWKFGSSIFFNQEKLTEFTSYQQR